MANEVLLDYLADTYQQAISDIQIAAEQAAIDAWFATDSFAGEDEDRWTVPFWTLTLAATTAVAFATRAYLQQIGAVTGYMLPLPMPDLSWVREDFDNWATSPMVRSRWLVSEGTLPPDAMQDASERVSKLVSSVTREAEQRTLQEILGSVQWEISWTVEDGPDTVLFPQTEAELARAAAEARANGARVKQRGKGTKFKRIPQAGACGWCLVVADRLYSAAARDNHPTGQWHVHCHCTWREVTSKEAKAFKPRYEGGEWRTVVEQRASVTSGDENA